MEEAEAAVVEGEVVEASEGEVLPGEEVTEEVGEVAAGEVIEELQEAVAGEARGVVPEEVPALVVSSPTHDLLTRTKSKKFSKFQKKSENYTN